jgi:nucleoside-diphosphate-sugar epimerase
MRVLVTGGAGFIGHHLVRALVDRGDEVVVLDDLSTGDTVRLTAVAPRIDFVAGSILDPDALRRAVGSCDVVFHLAAIASVARSLEDPVLSTQVNVIGSIEVMRAAAAAGVRRIVFASSSAVYGVPETLPCREDFRAEPESPYGAGKLAAEHDLRTLGSFHGLESISLRFFNVFGPGQDPASEYAAVIPRFITAVLEGRRPTVFGDGTATRDFIYVGDIVRAVLLAGSRDTGSGIACNVASGRATSLLGLLSAIAGATGADVEPDFGPPRSGDIPHSVADIGRAREVLGFEAEVTFDEGIRRTVAWYRDQLGIHTDH